MTESGTKSEKSARTRQRILDSAAAVLAEKGYAGLRMSDIAKLADYPAPAMYYYFKNRDELVDEVLQLGGRLTREHVEGVLDGLPAGTTPMERICAAAEAHVRFALQLPEYSVAVTRNMGQLPDPIRKRQLALQRRYGNLWRTLLRDAQENGDIASGVDLSVARMYVLGALNWIPEWWKPGQGSLESLITNVVRLTCAGLFDGKRPT